MKPNRKDDIEYFAVAAVVLSAICYVYLYELCIDRRQHELIRKQHMTKAKYFLVFLCRTGNAAGIFGPSPMQLARILILYECFDRYEIHKGGRGGAVIGRQHIHSYFTAKLK